MLLMLPMTIALLPCLLHSQMKCRRDINIVTRGKQWNFSLSLGVLPTKGLTLPLISSGGSSAMMMCIAIGLLLRVGHEVRVDNPGARSPGAGKPRPSATNRSKLAGVLSR